MLNGMKLVLKFILPFYITVDYGAAFTSEFVLVLTAFYLIYFGVRYNEPPAYNSGVYSFEIILDATLFWITICSCV